MERIERRLSVLYPPGTDIVAFGGFLNVGHPMHRRLRLELWEHCIYGEYEPTTPRHAYPDIWWVVRIQHELFGPWVHSYKVFAVPNSEVRWPEAGIVGGSCERIVTPPSKDVHMETIEVHFVNIFFGLHGRFVYTRPPENPLRSTSTSRRLRRTFHLKESLVGPTA